MFGAMASDSRGHALHLRPTALEPDALVMEIDAANFLRLSVRTLQAWRHQRHGPAFVRAGRAIRYRRADLVAWIDANRVSFTPPAHASETLHP